ncbi:MAG TPA: hypothetical protein DCR93_05535, partial [Cytophagales bacterium]|nr:hypothetical protein [Cytophagales bacterium]
MRNLLLFTTLALFFSCNSSTAPDRNAKALGHWEALCEMVKAGAKPLGVSYPMEAWDIEAFYTEAQEIAKEYGVETVREKDFLTVGLFDPEIVKGKEVVLVYQGNTYRAYQDLKQEVALTSNHGGRFPEQIGRRLGRLLGYSPQAINTLLAENTEFRALTNFGVRGQGT